MTQIELGRTGIMVSDWCLGTMTFTRQTPQADAHRQIDMALEAGVHFLDTAEMYPVNPVTADTQGDSERVIGNWIAKTGRRSDITVATKHSGNGLAHIRGGGDITSASIPEAIEGSLKRLQTDYIDLYQFHWPNRGSYAFRQNWHFTPSATQDKAATRQHMADALGALQMAVDAGKIRAFGLSNESAWGTAQWARLSEEGHGPRVATIQNEYSLLHRLYDTDLAEVSHHEDVGLLAFSPLATGLLTGKYQGDVIPDGTRRAVTPKLGGRVTQRVFPAVDAYLAIAQKHGLNPAQMAVAWTCMRPFMASSIIGATRLEQLPDLLAAGEMTLPDEVLQDIDAAHMAHPMPF